MVGICSEACIKQIVVEVCSQTHYFFQTGHPSYGHIGERVSRALSRKRDGILDGSVVVVGHGNVALDCARVLAKGSVGLFDTDIATRALDVLGNGVANISIVGRRGHVQGAFTIKELRELDRLENDGHAASFVVREDELDLGLTESSLDELNGLNGRPRMRINQLLRDVASKSKFTTCAVRQEILRYESS